ncbi:MAG TPA: hypothetical protein PKC76_03220 [Saprospiraceae bacterium]|nr:hypothetical protein [Saprospiraceae bacterium]HMP23114.1 hypothetical protein [Saprospiraceae bacterium]
MKTIWSILIAIFLFSGALLAQTNEFKIGYGIPSGTEIGVSLATSIGSALGANIGIGIGDVVSIIVSGVPTEVTVVDISQDNQWYGTALIGYQHHLNRRLSLGAQFNYNPMRITNTIRYSNDFTSTSTQQYDFVSLYARFDFRYVARPKFELYSAILAGAITDLRESGNINFAPHVTVLGFRIGQQHGFFTEFGLGLGPLFSASYGIKF